MRLSAATVLRLEPLRAPPSRAYARSENGSARASGLLGRIVLNRCLLPTAAIMIAEMGADIIRRAARATETLSVQRLRERGAANGLAPHQLVARFGRRIPDRFARVARCQSREFADGILVATVVSNDFPRPGA